MKKLRKGDNVELAIESLAFGGQGVAKTDDQVIFVRGGIPGQTVNVAITRKKKSYFGRIIIRSNYRIPTIYKSTM